MTQPLDQLLADLAPILACIHRLDLENPTAAQATLDAEFPLSGETMQHIKSLTRTGVHEGWLCTKESGGVRFSRPKKPTATDHLSIDAVHMKSPGPGHTHPTGEVDLAFSVDGTPTFDGRNEGWTVYPPNSWHIPTVENGTMDILYFVPDGILKFGPRPTS